MLFISPQSLGSLTLAPLAYFVLNLDPILFHLGPIAVHWYGLMYVVAITIGLWALLRYTRSLGIHDEQIWGLFFWTALAGLIGGRLYFVIQQPDLVQNYLLDPINIIAAWKGGMAFFGAIFLGGLTLFLLAPRYGLSRWIALDGGAYFAAIGQIFGRFGNIINGDILGAAASGPVTLPAGVCERAPCLAYVNDPHITPWWSLVYLNPHSLAPTGVPFQPAPVYEIALNLVALALLLPLCQRLPRICAGYFFALYAALYASSQFIVFFARDTEPIVTVFGLHILKQAQWTAIVVFILCIPLAIAARRFSAPWPYSALDPVPWLANDDPERPAPPPGAAATDRIDSPSAPSASARSLAPAIAVDLPPWSPARATGGRLRNLFGGASAPAPRDSSDN